MHDKARQILYGSHMGNMGLMRTPGGQGGTVLPSLGPLTLPGLPPYLTILTNPRRAEALSMTPFLFAAMTKHKMITCRRYFQTNNKTGCSFRYECKHQVVNVNMLSVTRSIVGHRDSSTLVHVAYCTRSIFYMIFFHTLFSVPLFVFSLLLRCALLFSVLFSISSSSTHSSPSPISLPFSPLILVFFLSIFNVLSSFWRLFLDQVWALHRP